MRSGWTRPRGGLVGVAAVALAAFLAPAAVPAGDPGGLRAEAERLRAESRGLAAAEQEALLELYALESELGRAQARLAALEERRARVAREEASARRQLGVARRDAAEAERRLAARLQTLYVEGDVDPLAVLLGAQSLDDALSALDGLGRAASLDRSILAQVRATRRALGGAVRRLAERQDELRALVGDAAAERDRLAAAQSSRAAYLAELTERREVAQASVSRLLAEAAAAEARAEEVAPPPPASGPSPAPPPEPAPTAPPPAQGGNRLTVSSTGYCLRGTTATGIPVGWGVVAVDPAVIPLGTRMTVPGYGEGVAADTGASVRGAVIDLWFPSCSQALAWGRRTVTITLH